MNPATPEPSLLLLIPAYNEEGRLGPVLREYGLWFREHYRGKFKLVVILNGCRDNTLGVVQEVARDFPCISALNFPEPIGKGGALIEGLKLASQFDLAGYVDADGATGPVAFHELVRHCQEADCVIGSRWLPQSVLHQTQPGQRQFASRVFHAIVQGFFWMGIRDTQCGAKVMHRKVVEKVLPGLHIADMAFDINLLFLIRRNGFRILEVPTEWTDKAGSKVSIGRTSFTMLLSVIRLRLIYSPFHLILPLFSPLTAWLYRKLRAPLPRPTERLKKDKEKRE